MMQYVYFWAWGLADVFCSRVDSLSLSAKHQIFMLNSPTKTVKLPKHLTVTQRFNHYSHLISNLVPAKVYSAMLTDRQQMQR